MRTAGTLSVAQELQRNAQGWRPGSRMVREYGKASQRDIADARSIELQKRSLPRRGTP